MYQACPFYLLAWQPQDSTLICFPEGKTTLCYEAISRT